MVWWRYESTGWRYHCQVLLSQALAISGQIDAAANLLDEIQRRPHPAFVFLDPDVLLARAWLAAGQGAVSQANASPTVAMRAGELGAPAGEAWRCTPLPGSVTLPSRSASTNCRAKLGSPRADRGYLRPCPGQRRCRHVLSASTAFESMGDRLAAADAAAQAASVYLSKGLRGSALGAAHALGVSPPNVAAPVLPALIDALHPLPLTSREREIATLAARGLSNRQIAEQLVLSVPTVEGHLYRATAKLGGVPRTRLPDVLAPEFE